MRLRHVTFGLGALLAALVSAAAGQDSTSHRVGPPQMSAALSDPTSENTRAVAPSAVASITAADKVIRGSLGRSFPLWRGVSVGPFLSASAPLDASDAHAPVVLADLRGGRAATHLSAGLNVTRWTPDAGDTASQRRICRDAWKDLTVAPKVVRDSVVKATRGVPADASAATRDSIIAWFATKGSCSRGNVPAARRTEFDQKVNYGTFLTGMAEVDYARESFKYADTVAVAFKKQTAEPWSATVGMGVYYPLLQTLIAATLHFERSYDPGTAQQYCVSVGATPALQCRSVPLGPPSSADKFLVTLELRHFVDAHYGLSPRFTLQIGGDHDWGVELPVLLRQDTDSGFSAAFSIGWRSRPSTPDADDRFYVALTLGASYGIGLAAGGSR